MCGIVGLFAKTPAIENHLGALLGDMLVKMTDRGPDSAGMAIYRPGDRPGHKLTLRADRPTDWDLLADRVRQRFGPDCEVAPHGTHAVVSGVAEPGTFQAWAGTDAPDLHVTASGTSIEIYKSVGPAGAFLDAMGIRHLAGRHGLGHTRMATESAVTTAHSHPFSTGEDLCLVHNGSLSNHNRLRAVLRRHGVQFETDNDSEVAAGFLTWRLREGDTLEQALEAALGQLDGFFTFAVGTRDGFAVLRDPIACKPAVMAETDDWVAMASEFRAIAVLPGANQARCWEPAPGRIYSWTH